MKLTDVMTGILAKAAARFGKHSGGGLFGDFEQRKTHLHQEVRVDRRGHSSQRWVVNEKKDQKGIDAQQAQGNMPSLFDARPQKPRATRPRVTKPTPKPQAPLFDFNFEAPVKGAPAPVDFKAIAAQTRALFDAKKPATVESAAHNYDYKGKPQARDGSLTMTQEEYRAQQAGVLMVGSTKQEHGHTYRLNDNHRWERVDAAPEGQEAAPSAALPSTIRTRAGDLAITPEGRVQGLSDQSQVKRTAEGQYHLHVPGGAPIHLTHDPESGTLSVTKPGAPQGSVLTPEATHEAVKEAVREVQRDPGAAPALRSAIKNDQLTHGQADGNTSHVATHPGDTPAPEGQAYLVGLPEGIKDRERRRLNLQAETLITALQDAPRETTLEERQLLARYSGNGGIGGSNNEYYTPPELGQAMWQVMAKLGSGTGRGLEPSCGPGVMVQFAPKDAQMDAVDISPISAGIANALFGHRHDVHSQPFEAFRQANKDERYDFAIGNPPFGTRDQNAFLDDDYQSVREHSRYFTLSTLDQLKEGGIAALVLPAGLARNKTDDDFRRRVLARAEIIAIHGLPTDTFARAGTETATTDVWIVRGRPEDVRGILDATLDQGFEKAGIQEADFIEGRWHAQHPEQMHGTVTQRAGNMGAMLYARDGNLTPELLTQLVTTTPTTPAQQTPSADELLEALKDNPRALAGYFKKRQGKDGDTRISDTGALQMVINGRWHNVFDDTPTAFMDGQQLSDLITLHGTLLGHGTYDEANRLRAQIVALTGQYVQKYGNPHQLADLSKITKETASLNNLLATIKPDGTLAERYAQDARPQEITFDKADPSSVLQYLRRTHEDATMQAMSRLTGEHPNALAPRLLAAGLAYHPQRRVWVTGGELYAGDSNEIQTLLQRGIDQAGDDLTRGVLEKQVAELRRRVPITPLAEFDVTPRDSWVDTEIVADFLYQQYVSNIGGVYGILPSHIEGWINNSAGTWEVNVPVYGNASTKKVANFIKRYLTGQGARSAEADEYTDLDEEFKDWLGRNERHAARVEDAYAARGTWLEPQWSLDPVDQQIPGWQSRANGGLDLHFYQNEAIHRSLMQGGGIIAHDVGLGKTSTGIAQAFYAKHTGLAQRPTVAVPKSVIGQWRQEAKQCKPDAKILVIGAEQQFSADGTPALDDQGDEIWNEVKGAAALDRQMADAKTNDWDLVLITHTTLGRVQFDGAQQLALIQDEFYDQQKDKYAKTSGMSTALYQQYAALKATSMLESGEISLDDLRGASAKLEELTRELKERFTSKSNLSENEKKDKKKKKEEQARLTFLQAAQRALSKEENHPLKTQWDELAIDHLIVDEAHEFKGLWTYSKSRGDKNIKYLGAPSTPSQKAIDLYYKTKAMREGNGGRGVYLLTATPIKNSPVELYNMLSYTAPELFQRLGINNLDQFVQRYCRIEEHPIFDEDTGETKYVSVLVGLKNLKELRKEAARYINRKTAEQVGLSIPFHDREVIHVEPRAEQADLIKWIAQHPVEAARDLLGADVPSDPEQLSKEYDKLAQRYALALPHLTRRAELDMEMIDPDKHKGYVSPKVDEMLKDITPLMQAGEKCVIFCDTTNMPGVRGGKANPNGYSFHDKLRRIISQRSGVPLEKIAVVNADTCPTADDRLAISNGVKSGKYQIVIGNTSTMGQGMNLQHDVGHMRNLDVPWNPAIDQQRVGRVVRQGNKRQTVTNRTYLGTRGLDKDMYDVLGGKNVWYNEFWNGDSDSMDTDGQQDYRITPERLAALAIDDPQEREAALSKISAGEREQRQVGQRVAAVKQFWKLQSTHKALGEARGTLARAAEKATERQKGMVKALEASHKTQTEKLRGNPAFAPFTAHLDNPEHIMIDPGSGTVYRVGQKLTAENGDGQHTHLIVTGGHPRKGLVTLKRLNIAGVPYTSVQDTITMSLSDLAQTQQGEYDEKKHLHTWVKAEGGHISNYGADALLNLNRLSEQHGDTIRAALTERDQDASNKQYDSTPRLIRRNGEVMLESVKNLQPGDQYLVPGEDKDAAREFAERLTSAKNFAAVHELGQAMRRQMFHADTAYTNGQLKFIVKADLDTRRFHVHTSPKGGQQ